MRGRKPKPTALKLLQGNPGHRKIDELTEPQPVIGLGEPPAHLAPDAVALWYKLGPQLVTMKTLGESDAELFAILCQAHADNLWHSAQVTRLRGLKRLTGKQANQLAIHESARRKAGDSYHKLCAEFGVGAVARTRIKLPPADGQTELPFDGGSPLDRIIGGVRAG